MRDSAMIHRLTSLLETEDSAAAEPVTAIIVTRQRPAQLKRALRSLDNQLGVAVEVHIMVDDCDETMAFLAAGFETRGAIRSLDWTRVRRRPRERSGPRRVACLRNIGLDFATRRWCSFLDDDNQLEIDHIESLRLCALKTRAPVAHSWRTLWSTESEPFHIRDTHPWSRDPQLGRMLFKQYADAGIYESGSHVVRDQVVPKNRAASMVDTSEWLFSAAFIRSIGFDEEYSEADWIASRSEDSKLLDRIVELDITIPTTAMPTLRYFMGGYSNAWVGDGTEKDAWQ